MKLAEIQATFHQALRGESTPEAAAAALGADPRRLAIYTRFARGHVASALESNLPVFRARASDDWPAIVDAYFAAHPPRHWALNHAAQAFPGFVQATVEATAGAPHGEGPARFGWTAFETCLAQAEWALYRALSDTAPRPGPQAPLGLNPTLVPMQFPYPVADVMLAHGRGEAPPRPAPAPSIVFFYQSPATGNGRYQKARPDLLFAVKAVDAGLDPAAAAAASGQPLAAVRAAYSAAADVGLIVGWSAG